MSDYIEILENNNLFKNISRDEIIHMLNCIPNHTSSYKEGEYIFRVGDTVSNVYVVLKGAVQLEHTDYWGNFNIISVFTKGSMFGESFAFLEGNREVSLSVKTTEDTVIMALDSYKILTMCTNACLFHNKLIRNLVSIMSNKNTLLNKKMMYLSERSIKSKLLAYLSDCQRKEKSSKFSIKYNRQELADFLSVDRSAMSKELSKLKKEGILDYHKNHFELY